MNRKALSTLLIIFEMIVIVVVMLGTFRIADKLAKSERVLKTNVANNIRLAVETIVAMPGDAQFSLLVDSDPYIITLYNDHVQVMKPGDSEEKRIISKFVLPAQHHAIGVAEEENHICLKKETVSTGKTITILPC